MRFLRRESTLSLNEKGKSWKGSEYFFKENWSEDFLLGNEVPEFFEMENFHFVGVSFREGLEV